MAASRAISRASVVEAMIRRWQSGPAGFAGAGFAAGAGAAAGVAAGAGAAATFTAATGAAGFTTGAAAS